MLGKVRITPYVGLVPQLQAADFPCLTPLWASARYVATAFLVAVKKNGLASKKAYGGMRMDEGCMYVIPP